MATYTLIPSSLTGYDEITNASNAYTDTDSSTYAEVEYFGSAWLSGFDFSVIPSGETVSSIVVKCKVGNSTDEMSLYGTSSGTALSQAISLADAVTVYTFTLTESASTIMQYSSTLGIKFEPTSLGGYAEIYGAEIIITTSANVPNKIIYGGNTLIDLTGDTATASDVAVGKTFHLASGIQATGALSVSTKKASLSSAGRTISFTGLEKEPSWFVAILDGASTRTSYPAPAFLFNGTACFALYCYSTSSNAGVTCNCSSTSDYTFTYSSGTLRLDINGSYFPKGSFILYYL